MSLLFVFLKRPYNINSETSIYSILEFVLHPVLEEMSEFYRLPRTPARFQTYLEMLQGDTKDDMRLPIMNYNPMAKDHIHDKIEELQNLGAEQIAKEVFINLNRIYKKENFGKVKTVFNIADDLGGAWTNRFSTDYDSKFKTTGLFNRGFCAPIFWSSEAYTPELVKERTIAYALRTLYRFKNPKLKTLEEHLTQEIFVERNNPYSSTPIVKEGQEELTELYEAFKKEDDFGLIFNFFYGDEISQGLSYSTYGVGTTTGFSYAKYLAEQE